MCSPRLFLHYFNSVICCYHHVAPADVPALVCLGILSVVHQEPATEVLIRDALVGSELESVEAVGRSHGGRPQVD